ncbi:uncharacterized protein LOC117646511 isoform X2 [Thrips palmi]|nr:uncharacterized protein LOC117646511 isoform X2 [Thrips palmi]
MSRSGPVGSLGGGGWAGASPTVPNPDGSFMDNSKESKRRDKVLADMYEMFLDSVEPEVIQSVVHSCGFNHKKSMDALLDICGTKNAPTGVQSAQKPSKPALNGTSPASAIRSHAAFSGNNRSPVPETPRSNSSSGAIPRKPLTNSLPMERPVKNVQPVATDKMRKVRWYIENGKRIMILMRGCPGSGKSYLAQGLVLSYGGKPKDYVFSTDDYFMKRNGYDFHPAQLSEAHQWNQTRVLKKVREGLSPVIVDNTNTQLWEMTLYASMAVNYGYLIEILEPDTPWFSKLNELFKRNKHGVPRENLRNMLDRYESGISVDDLIKSTGANYSRPPPQPAEHCLVSPMAVGAPSLVPLKNANPEQRINKKETTLLAELKDTNLTSQVNSKSLTGGEGFYFGQNANSSLNFYTLGSKQGNNSSPPDAFNLLLNSNSRGSDIFSRDFKPGLESITGGKELGINEKLAVSSSKMFPMNDTSDFLLPFSQIPKRNEESSSGFSVSVEKNNIAAVTSEQSDRKNPSLQDSLYSKDTTTSVAFVQDGEDKEDKILLNSVVQSNANASSDNSSSISSLAPLDVLLKETPVSCPVDLMGSADAQETKSSMKTQPLISTASWIGMADWNVGVDKNESNDVIQQNPLPKPPRSFNMKNIQDYCQSVKDLNAASPIESTGWAHCDDNLISWQPIDKIQQGLIYKEESAGPQSLLDNSQRSRFVKVDVQDKETNTHHADFCTLSQVSSNGAVDGVVVLNTYDRDINKGRTVHDFKIPLKLKLDKGTVTENDFEMELKTESKQEKIKELSRLFPNKSTASLKEFLKQCNWDVNYVSNLLLDETDNDALCTSFVGDDSIDSDSDVEPSTQEPPEENLAVTETIICNEPNDDQNTSNAIEEAEEVKRHIESSIDFSERSYSPHLLAIKNFRRGLREGAIPKSTSPVSEDPFVIPQGLSDECNEPTPEPSQSPSESSDGDESNETLEFIVGQDFVQQLADKFGGSCNVGNVSPLVKFPISLARQIHDIIFASNEEEDGDFAMKLQCEEDERLARQLYDEMMSSHAKQRADTSPPQLREIMDMELAQAIYKADVDSLSRNTPETAANILAKRLLEENYSNIDKRTLHDIYVSCNYSFEDTVKTLQEALSSDGQVFGVKGTAEREQELIRRAQQASMQGTVQGAASVDVFSDGSLSRKERGCQRIEDSIENDNPWDLSDPKAYYNKYRAKADEYLKERDEMYRKASEAFKRQQRSVAAYYAKLGELNGKKYQNASAMAAASLAAAQADSQSDTLDLHNFKVAEAVIVFDLFIDFRIRLLSERGASQECLSIITGRGSHSVNGKPRIKPAIINRAKKRNLRCQTLQNPGVVRVWASSDSKPSHEID